jgi:hypothetical protein
MEKCAVLSAAILVLAMSMTLLMLSSMAAASWGVSVGKGVAVGVGVGSASPPAQAARIRRGTSNIVTRREFFIGAPQLIPVGDTRAAAYGASLP